jgi:ankyrin repeat protein
MSLFWKNKKTEFTLDDVSYEIQHFDNQKAKNVLTQIGIDSVDEFGRTALIWACFAENMELINWLIENNAKINHQDKKGYSALHFVAQEKNKKAAEYLLSKGSETEVKDIHQNTPLWTAVFNAKEDLSIVELLLKNNANLDTINLSNRTPREMAEKMLGEEYQELKRKLNIK